MKTSVRINNDEYDKENAADFALWKAWKDEDGENFIFGVDISYALYHALCRRQRERMNGIFMY